jgi:outer membrane protein assembly factor BamE (lipoprotein component of BamABCDE complex)
VKALLAVFLLAGCAAAASPDSRLTRENMGRLQPGVSRESDVRELLGAPDRVQSFPRMARVAWSYPAPGMERQLIIVQFSADGIVREAYMIDDPEFVSAAE